MTRPMRAPRLVRPARVLVVIPAAATLAAGCSWFSKDEKPPAPLPDFRAVANAAIGWQQPLEAAGAAGFSPVGSGDAVYAATADGTLASCDAGSGRLNWRIKTGG